MSVVSSIPYFSLHLISTKRKLQLPYKTRVHCVLKFLPLYLYKKSCKSSVKSICSQDLIKNTSHFVHLTWWAFLLLECRVEFFLKWNNSLHSASSSNSLLYSLSNKIIIWFRARIRMRLEGGTFIECRTTKLT